MTSKSSIFLLLIVVLILNQSCSIEKRVHQNGFHITWKKSIPTVADNSVEEKEENVLYASTEEEFILPTQKSLFEENEEIEPADKESPLNEECDVITTMDGDEISCLVKEIGVTEIKYKKCGFEDGPTISILRNDVFMIKYRNGEKELIEHEEEKKESRYDALVNSNNNPHTNEPSSSGRIAEGFGIASFVLGILGMLTLLYTSVLGSLLSLALAVIFGLISLGKFSNNPEKYKGKGLPITGFILGAAGLLIFLFLLL